MVCFLGVVLDWTLPVPRVAKQKTKPTGKTINHPSIKLFKLLTREHLIFFATLLDQEVMFNKTGRSGNAFVVSAGSNLIRIQLLNL